MTALDLAVAWAPYVPSNPNDGGVPTWLAITIAVVVVLLIAVAVLVVRRMMPKSHEDARRRIEAKHERGHR